MEMLKFVPSKELLHNGIKPTSLCKTIKQNQKTVLEKRVMLQMQEIKTVKSLNKKSQKIPILNMVKLVGMQRMKAQSNNTQIDLQVQTERRTKQTRPANCYLSDSPLLISPLHKSVKNKVKNSEKKRTIQVQTVQRKPFIIPYDLTSRKSSLLNFYRYQGMGQNSIQPHRKKSPRNLPCKVLMSKYTHFPLIDNLTHNISKSDSISSKKTQNTQNKSDKVQLFDLDISRIDKLQGLPIPVFITKDSYQEIAIF